MSNDLDGVAPRSYAPRMRKMHVCHLCRMRRVCDYVSLDFREGEGDWTAYNCWLCFQCATGAMAAGCLVLNWGQAELFTHKRLSAT